MALLADEKSPVRISRLSLRNKLLRNGVSVKNNSGMEIFMNILVYKWDIYQYNDIIQAFTKQGHHTDVLAFPISSHIKDDKFDAAFRQKLNSTVFDLVFSVNYYTVIATVCEEYQIPYASWTCDSPLLSLQHPAVFSPYNYIFLFDYKEYRTLLQRGVKHAYYLPLAGLNLDNDFFFYSPTNYNYEISFVGNLYDRNRYDDIIIHLPEYLRGYIDAAIESQKHVSGGNLLTGMLHDEILEKLTEYINIKNGTNSLEELKLHFATSVLAYKTTADIRTEALNMLAKEHNTNLFTTSSGEHCKNVVIQPPVNYNFSMPYVFHTSKINLNFTLPSIENGIPLRVFDVLASGGFLLTDYREALLKEFKDGTELVIFDGMTDLKEKATYYLKHEQERKRIAENGQKKVQQLHQYDIRLKKILHTIFSENPIY